MSREGWIHRAMQGGRPAPDKGLGHGAGQDWAQPTPWELASHESHQGHVQSPGVVLLAASFQVTWCNHVWMSAVDVGEGESSLFVPGSPAPRWVLVMQGCSLLQLGPCCELCWHRLP